MQTVRGRAVHPNSEDSSMTLLRKLIRINDTAASFICRRNIDYTIDVHIVGKIEGPGSVPIPGVGVFVLKTGQIPKDGSPQPLPFVGASRSDGSLDIKFKYMWGNKTAWWHKQNSDTTFSLHFVHDDFNIEVVPVVFRGATTEVVSETNLKLERLTDDEAQKVRGKGSRIQYLRKRDPEPGEPGESWDPDQPWPHEAAFGGDTFTIEGNCADQNQKIVDGVRWAYWQLRNGNIVTDPGLRVCIMEHMNNASVSCAGGDCNGNTNGYNNDYGFFQSPNIVMCLDQIKAFSATAIGLLAIHEWAHSCGWNHGDGKGVPGDSGVGLALAVIPRVAFNPQDKWVMTMGNRVLVIVNNGPVHRATRRLQSPGQVGGDDGQPGPRHHEQRERLRARLRYRDRTGVPARRAARCLQPAGQMGGDDGQPDPSHHEQRERLRA
jgi:hypothetical protein